jgi:hypothetical protein
MPLFAGDLAGRGIRLYVRMAEPPHYQQHMHNVLPDSLSRGQGGWLLKGRGHHLARVFVSGRRARRFAAQRPGTTQVGAPRES